MRGVMEAAGRAARRRLRDEEAPGEGGDGETKRRRYWKMEKRGKTGWGKGVEKMSKEAKLRQRGRERQRDVGVSKDDGKKSKKKKKKKKG